jgi:hypothetical protein
MRILPGGDPVVVSTHDQVLGGELGQTFVARRFPAQRAYTAAIVRDARKIGASLAAEGVVGRFGIDFVVARRDGDSVPNAVEIKYQAVHQARQVQRLFGPVTQRNDDGTTIDFEGTISGTFNSSRTRVSGTWAFKGTEHDAAGAVTDTCDSGSVSWSAKQ